MNGRRGHERVTLWLFAFAFHTLSASITSSASAAAGAALSPVAAQATPAHIRVRATNDRVEDITAPGPIVWRASGNALLEERGYLGRGWSKGKSDKPPSAPLTPTAHCSWSKKASKIRQVSVGQTSARLKCCVFTTGTGSRKMGANDRRAS